MRLPHRLRHQLVQLLHALRECQQMGLMLIHNCASDAPPQYGQQCLALHSHGHVHLRHSVPASDQQPAPTWSYASCVMSTPRGSWLPLITTRTVSSAE